MRGLDFRSMSVSKADELSNHKINHLTDNFNPAASSACPASPIELQVTSRLRFVGASERGWRYTWWLAGPQADVSQLASYLASFMSDGDVLVSG